MNPNVMAIMPLLAFLALPASAMALTGGQLAELCKVKPDPLPPSECTFYIWGVYDTLQSTPLALAGKSKIGPGASWHYQEAYGHCMPPEFIGLASSKK